MFRASIISVLGQNIKMNNKLFKISTSQYTKFDKNFILAIKSARNFGKCI